MDEALTLSLSLSISGEPAGEAVMNREGEDRRSVRHYLVCTNSMALEVR